MQYARSMIEASLDPLVAINNEGKIIDSNQAFAIITGMSSISLNGTELLSYFNNSNKARGILKRVYGNESVVNIPLNLKSHANKSINLLINASVLKDEEDHVIGAILIAKDITEQNRISAELTEAIVFAEMATAIAEEAKIKADEARKIAEAAVKSKQQFLSNMSHEIRTPMNAIIGFTKVMLKTELSPKQKEYLTAIKTSGDALIVLINDILDLSKVDAGKMIFEEVPFRISNSVSAMLHLFELKAQEKNLALKKEYDSRIPEVLLGDPVRLHQIILNLVGNAVKFTKKGSISMNIQMLKEDDEKVLIEFTITDTGIGISAEKVPSIFENFQQATSDTSRVFGGTGLGLAIVKQLVEAQGGNIKVESKVDEGSTFQFSLHFKKTSQEALPDPIIAEHNTTIQNAKILVVEDIPLNQLLMRTIMDDFGFECDIAVNGKVAVEKVQSKAYDIILMDLQMPEMNGFEATEYIRKNLNIQIPIIALTADVTTADLSRCKAAGMNDYISKPLDEKLLRNKIMFFLKKAAAKKQNTSVKKEEKKYINLQYLIQRTKSDPLLMTEMITLYLGQTRSLIKDMKKSFENKNWKELQAIAHKMIPSFSIVGMGIEYELLAKNLLEQAGKKDDKSEIENIVKELEKILNYACQELEIEMNRLNKKKK
jgi:PAS domain S-box-containing protein